MVTLDAAVVVLDLYRDIRRQACTSAYKEPCHEKEGKRVGHALQEEQSNLHDEELDDEGHKAKVEHSYGGKEEDH